MLRKLSAIVGFLITFCFTITAQVSDFQVSGGSVTNVVRNETDVIRTLHDIHDAENTYFMTVGALQFGSLPRLGVFNLVDETLATGEKYGYRFYILPVMFTSITPSTFEVWATPQRYLRTGRRSFYMDGTGVIRAVDNQGSLATINDKPIFGQCSPSNCYTAALQSLRTIYDAQVTYRATSGNGNFGTLHQLFRASLIDASLAMGRKNGYSYLMLKRNQSNQCSATFSMVIIPQSGLIGDSLYIDETGIIRKSWGGTGKPADQDDPPHDAY